jgi:hypothetical protein
MSHTSYAPNTADCIFQNIDNEIIILNLKNGNYFSLDNLGVLVWEMITQSLPLDSMSVLFSGLPSVAAAEISSSIANLLEDMQREGLILACEPSSGDATLFVATAQTAISEGRVCVKPLVLNAYKHIQEKYAHPCGVKEI